MISFVVVHLWKEQSCDGRWAVACRDYLGERGRKLRDWRAPLQVSLGAKLANRRPQDLLASSFAQALSCSDFHLGKGDWPRGLLSLHPGPVISCRHGWSSTNHASRAGCASEHSMNSFGSGKSGRMRIFAETLDFAHGLVAGSAIIATMSNHASVPPHHHQPSHFPCISPFLFTSSPSPTIPDLT